jgi:anti-anti-sigma factor
MAIFFVDRSSSFRHITLSGRLDAMGSQEIAQELADLTALEKRQVIVDLTGVTCLTSPSIRLLIMIAGAQRKLDGRIVLLIGNNALVAKTLLLAGIKRFLPISHNYPEAEGMLLDKPSLIMESSIAEFAH